MGTSETVVIERDGDLVTVVLNRPEKLNALDLETWMRLGKAIETLDADDRVRCIVVRGAGGRAFGAGADVSAFAAERSDSRQAQEYGGKVGATMTAIGGCRHPTVALIEGVCVGGGLEIALCCDLRICGRSSRFGIPVNRLGLTMGFGELEVLLAVVGRAAALEILLEGSVFGADKALSLGLVNRVVADDAVAEETYATARRIAAGAPLVNRWHKKFIRRLADPTPLTEAERDEAFACFGTKDFETGYKAFLAKVKPTFEGR